MKKLQLNILVYSQLNSLQSERRLPKIQINFDDVTHISITNISQDLYTSSPLFRFEQNHQCPTVTILFPVVRTYAQIPEQS